MWFIRKTLPPQTSCNPQRLHLQRPPRSISSSLPIIIANMNADLPIVIDSDSENGPVGTAAKPIPIDSDSEDETEQVRYSAWTTTYIEQGLILSTDETG